MYLFPRGDAQSERTLQEYHIKYATKIFPLIWTVTNEISQPTMDQWEMLFPLRQSSGLFIEMEA